MFLKKSNMLIYIFLFSLFINFTLPIYSLAIDDNIYVWSNNSSSISTSNTISVETENSR